MELLRCTGCNQPISATALACPACGKSGNLNEHALKSAKTAAKWVAISASAVALGPAAILGGALAASSVPGRASQRQLRKVAKEVKAIDGISLGKDFVVIFTREGFLPLLILTWDKEAPIPKPRPYASMISIAIDESRTETTGLTGREKIFVVLKFKFSKREIANQAVLPEPVRPKPRERFLLGKKLYESMIADAAEWDRSGGKNPDVVENGEIVFSISQKNARKLAEFACAKFEEYAWGNSSEKPQAAEAEVGVENDQAHYETAWTELESGNLQKGAWAKAFALADGNDSGARANYIKIRVEELSGGKPLNDAT